MRFLFVIVLITALSAPSFGQDQNQNKPNEISTLIEKAEELKLRIESESFKAPENEQLATKLGEQLVKIEKLEESITKEAEPDNLPRRIFDRYNRDLKAIERRINYVVRQATRGSTLRNTSRNTTRNTTRVRNPVRNSLRNRNTTRVRNNPSRNNAPVAVPAIPEVKLTPPVAVPNHEIDSHESVRHESASLTESTAPKRYVRKSIVMEQCDQLITRFKRTIKKFDMQRKDHAVDNLQVTFQQLLLFVKNIDDSKDRISHEEFVDIKTLLAQYELKLEVALEKYD